MRLGRSFVLLTCLCLCIFSGVDAVCDPICDEGQHCTGGGVCRTCLSTTYCPNGLDEISCEPGFYCPTAGLTDHLLCEGGYYCVAAVETGAECGLGNRCPIGSATPTACDVGYYCPSLNDNVQTICPEGKYCDSMGISSVSGTCDDVYYCPEGSTEINADACPVGFYCLAGKAFSCPMGHYCSGGVKESCPEGFYNNEAGQTSCYKLCDQGYYCPNGSVTSLGNGPCDDGYYCSVGSSSSQEEICPIGYFCSGGYKQICGLGYYNDEIGNTACTKQCLPNYFCPGGSISETGNGLCSEGYYCPIGSGSATQVECETGNYCTGGEKFSCGAGFYNDETGKTACTKQCFANYYCPGGSVSGIGNGQCDEGYYCPLGSSSATQIQCEEGSFCTGGAKSPCSPGYYNDEVGKTACTKQCLPNYFCPGGSISETGNGLCSEGYYCPIGSGSATQVECETGNFCTGGEKFACGAGFYNDEVGKTACTKQCLANYYCPGGSVSDTGNGLCSEGYYCLIGSGSATQVECEAGSYCTGGEKFPCGAGFYNDEVGKTACTKQCLANYYCPGGSAIGTGNGLCSEGYYCLTGSSSPTQVQCEAGSYCTGGEKFPCAAGFYNDEVGKTACTKQCLAKYHCPGGSISDTGNGLCSEGYYCPIGTPTQVECETGNYCTGGEKFPCAAGLYNDELGQTSCTKSCLASYFCPGGSSVGTGNGPCSEGYYCPIGSSSATQVECEAGNYCTGGEKFPCPLGFFNDEVGKTACTKQCLANYFCPGGSTSETGNGLCSEGYYCAVGSGSATQVECENGFYCTGGEKFPCPPGFYNDEVGKTSCTKQCLANYFCPGASNSETGSGLCSEGYYCPIGSGSATQVECEAGNYCTGGERFPCLPGKYQNNTGKISCDSPCKVGYYCEGGSSTEFGSGVCDEGYWCGSGSSSAQENISGLGYSCIDGLRYKCDAGWYQDQLGQTDCSSKVCADGYYCPAGSTSEEGIGLCPEGYYCPFGVEMVACDKGYYCTPGSRDPCPAGLFNDMTGQIACSKICEPGFYCPSGSISREGKLSDIDSDRLCDEGFYCPAGSKTSKGWIDGDDTDKVCDDGYYCPPGSSSANEEICAIGSYCVDGFEYLCDAGTYNDIVGRDEECADFCQEGHYCPVGSGSSIVGAGVCDPGYFCDEGSYSSTQNICPTGHFCVSGLKYECPGGTFNNAVARSECEICPAGFFCEVASVKKTGCGDGFICEEGTNSENEIACTFASFFFELLTFEIGPPGFFCAKGFPRECAAGFYNSEYGKSNCTEVCDAGFYCPRGSDNSQGAGFCNDGFHCPEGSTNPSQNICGRGKYCKYGNELDCPAGTYNGELGATNCTSHCEHGYYCPLGSIDEFGRSVDSDVVKKCKEGKYCLVGEKDENGSGDCENGFYCPEGSPSKNYLECPAKYYCVLGLKLACPKGYFCDGNSEEPVPCKEGEICEEGTDFPVLSYNPTSLVTGLSVSTGVFGLGVCIVVVFVLFCIVTIMRKKNRKNKIAPVSEFLTFAFTDIEDSTRLWVKFKKDMFVHLKEHDQLIRAKLKIFGGYEVKQIGDAFFAAFTSAKDAVDWAVSIQRSLLEGKWMDKLLEDDLCKPVYENEELIYKGLRVRVALHTGGEFKRIYNKEFDRYDYLGNTVNKTSRMEKYSKGGQIVISGDLKKHLDEAEGEEDSNDYLVRQVQTVDLKGLTGKHQLFEVVPHELLGRSKRDPLNPMFSSVLSNDNVARYGRILESKSVDDLKKNEVEDDKDDIAFDDLFQEKDGEISMDEAYDGSSEEDSSRAITFEDEEESTEVTLEVDEENDTFLKSVGVSKLVENIPHSKVDVPQSDEENDTFLKSDRFVASKSPGVEKDVGFGLSDSDDDYVSQKNDEITFDDIEESSETTHPNSSITQISHKVSGAESGSDNECSYENDSQKFEEDLKNGENFFLDTKFLDEI